MEINIHEKELWVKLVIYKGVLLQFAKYRIARAFILNVMMFQWAVIDVKWNCVLLGRNENRAVLTLLWGKVKAVLWQCGLPGAGTSLTDPSFCAWKRHGLLEPDVQCTDGQGPLTVLSWCRGWSTVMMFIPWRPNGRSMYHHV